MNFNDFKELNNSSTNYTSEQIDDFFKYIFDTFYVHMLNKAKGITTFYAEDAISNVLFNLLKTNKKPQVKTKEELKAYLLRAVKNEAVRLKTRFHKETTMDDPYSIAPPELPISTSLLSEELQLNIAKLPTIQRDAILLQLEGYTCQETGIKLDKSTSNVTTILSRAKKRLKSLFEP
jgi:RNA polymerase sigma factor (sigma-70 family)